MTVLAQDSKQLRPPETFLGRQAERIARATDRRRFLKTALTVGVGMTLLSKVEGARAAILSPNCCCCSPACWNVTNCQGANCGCSKACCHDPAGSTNLCQKRYEAHGTYYSWTCPSGGTMYVCSDYWCGGSSCGHRCICSYPCSGNECGTGGGGC